MKSIKVSLSQSIVLIKHDSSLTCLDLSDEKEKFTLLSSDCHEDFGNFADSLYVERR